jgi:L-iditol 2-dehydrogenase
MLAAAYTQNQGFRVEDVPVPEIAGDELLVEVMASSICGTDLRIIRSGHRKLRERQRIVLGHEFAGVIVEVGRKLEGAYRVGQRIGVAPNMGCGRCPMCSAGMFNMCPEYTAFGITMDGGHTQFVRIPSEAIVQGSVMSLPEGVSFADASLVEPLSCVVNGNRSVRMQLGDVVVVFGAGPIGLLHLLLARHTGASKVVVVDLQAHRLAKARALGADVVVDSGQEDARRRVMEETGGFGADVVITACSVPAVQEQSLELLAPFGRVCYFGGLPRDGSSIRIDSNLIHYKNLVVTGVTGGSPRDFRAAMSLVACGRVDVRQVVSHTFSAADLAEAFRVALHEETMKVVVQR